MISDMTSEGNRAAAGSVQPIATSTSFNPPLRISARDSVNEILKKAFEEGNFDAIQTACKKGDLVLIEAIHKVNQSILSKPISSDWSSKSKRLKSTTFLKDSSFKTSAI